MIFRTVVLGLLLGLLPAVFSQSIWRAARPDYVWEFPRDHWAHQGYKTEWWYFTGHLESLENPERRFGYQFTLFKIALGPDRLDWKSRWATPGLVMGHAAVTDLASGRHLFSEVLYREIPLLGGFGSYPERRIGWSRGPAGTEETWELTWNGNGFDFQMRDVALQTAFRLSTRPQKPLVFQGPNGFSRKGSSLTAASQYYSFTRLRTEGDLDWEGERHRVIGESWMDKEFGSNQLSEGQVGWDWFSLQLEDGRELMLYHLRDAGGGVDFARGTLVSSTGEATHLVPGQWQVRVLRRWESPETKALYPSRWEIRLEEEGLELDVVPLVPDQENRSDRVPTLHYWEGAVEVLDPEGRFMGRGYVELTGYGTGSRPPV